MFASSGSPIDPTAQFAAVTTSDTAVLKYHNSPARTKGIYVGGAGNLAVKDLGDFTGANRTTVIFIGVLAGVVYPISTDQILATGTTATNLIALF